jgi:hypothetical protein
MNNKILIGAALSLIVRAATAVPVVYTDEGLFLADLAALGHVVVHESFEDDTAWADSRNSIVSPGSAPSVTNQGILWTSNYPQNNLATGTVGGSAPDGLYAIYSLPHGMTTDGSILCDQLEILPEECYQNDGLKIQSATGSLLYAFGGHIDTANNGKVTFLLDGIDVFANDTDNINNVRRDGEWADNWAFVGVIDSDGFSSAELRELRGKDSEQVLLFADDFTIGTSQVTDPPAVDIEKRTNGKQADGSNAPGVPRLVPGETVTWSYRVTNTGGMAFSEAEVSVTDSQPGIMPLLTAWSDDGDMILSPGETWTYIASAQALDLAIPPAGVTVVPGCNDGRNTYQNIGRVDIAGLAVFDEDPSHYCNAQDFDNDGIPDQDDNFILVANGPLAPDAGGNSQLDTDGDGYGNICDPDFNNNLTVEFADLALMKSAFFSSNPDADLDGSGSVSFADLAIMKAMFFGAPGPSGLVP